MKNRKYLLIILLFLCSYCIFAEGSDNEPEKKGEFSWFNECTLAYSYNGYSNIYLGYETFFSPNIYLPYPFGTFACFFNINFQFQFSTNNFYIRSQQLILFPYPVLLGIDFSYNINNNSYIFSEVLGICLFYPGAKIMLKKDIFTGRDKLEIILAVSIPFFVVEKEY
jgi:hypothetical protein